MDADSVAAARAIATSAMDAQAAGSHARQSAGVADTEGGIFSALLAQLLQIAPAEASQEQSTAEQSPLAAQQGTFKTALFEANAAAPLPQPAANAVPTADAGKPMRGKPASPAPVNSSQTNSSQTTMPIAPSMAASAPTPTAAVVPMPPPAVPPVAQSTAASAGTSTSLPEIVSAGAAAVASLAPPVAANVPSANSAKSTAANPSAAQSANTGTAISQAVAAHQGATTPVAEAQALPLHMDLLDTKSANAPGGQPSAPLSQHSSATGSSTAQQTQSNAAGNSPATANANTPAAASPAHMQNTPAQPSDSPAPQSAPAASTSFAAAASAGAAQPASPSAASALQIGPTSTAAGESPQPNVPALAVSIAMHSQAGAKQFDIRLDPPELGRVDVRLTVDSTGKAQAHLAVDKPQTLELLQRDSGTLARALKDSGVQLNNNGLQFSLKGQDRQGSGAQPRGRALAVTAVPSSAPTAGNTSSANIFTSGSGVDIRV